MAQVHVLTGPERRRRWSVEQKRAIVAAAFAPGAVVSDVARRADVCSSLVYRWRREFAAAQSGFSEVIVGAPDGHAAALSVQPSWGDAPTGAPQSVVGEAAAAIEVTVDGRAGVRIPSSIPPELAAAVIAALVRR